MDDDLGVGNELSLALIGIKVRGDITLDVLQYAIAALAEAGTIALRTDDPAAVADHVTASLEVIQRRLDALAEPEEGTDAA